MYAIKKVFEYPVKIISKEFLWLAARVPNAVHEWTRVIIFYKNIGQELSDMSNLEKEKGLWLFQIYPSAQVCVLIY